MHSGMAVPRPLARTWMPFLYPALDGTWSARSSTIWRGSRASRPSKRFPGRVRCQGTVSADVHKYDHLDPSPPDYSSQPFTDACAVTVAAGGGGHGCISFLREKYVANGPPNGGDGGTGGGIYIQAVRGETSLHKLARRGSIKAGRGKNGQGSLRGGVRGEDVLLVVPVGTVLREIWRHDPLIEEDKVDKQRRGYGRDVEDAAEDSESVSPDRKWRRNKWLLYPGALPKNFSSADLPALPRPRRSHLTATEPPAPLQLDLDKPMDHPMLLTAGAMGGLGNPHFVTKSVPRPKFATKGEDGTTIHLQLELKLLADVGLVGLPNAGKSTLLRALTRSRTRIGDWAFTTLAPNVGTVVLDSHTGRPAFDTKGKRKEPRINFTIADIPGLVEDAHLDRGLGLGFLRHIERAAVLAFVVDLGAGDAVAALKALWREVGEYEGLRLRELNAPVEHQQPDEDGTLAFEPFSSPISDGNPGRLNKDPDIGGPLLSQNSQRISSKPWFVVATKADLPGTHENFMNLQRYMQAVQAGAETHPAGKENAWRERLHVVPVSAINKEGVAGIPRIVLDLLED